MLSNYSNKPNKMNSPMTPSERLQATYQKQYKASRKHAYPSIQERKGNLEKLAQLLESNTDRICAAIDKDFGGRSANETLLLELTPLLGSVSYAKKRLNKWAKPKSRHVGLTFIGASNKLIPQPKGVIGIITPWNYPLFLALSPCISALAAGNRCIIKMAANSQNLCRLMDELVSAVFDDEVLAVIPAASAREFSSMPWDHMVFTGSATTGKVVMEAASKNLTPVTLELGGKSPTIIAPDYNMRTAAERMTFTKFLNAGQTCVAPDYLFVQEGKVEEFVKHAKEIVGGRYDGINNQDLTAIIDEAAFTRLKATLEDAKEKGGEVINLLQGADLNTEGQKIAPHIIVNPTDDMIVMQDEIFGPLLPIKTYKSLDEVVEYINERDRPLALYIFSNDKKIQDDLFYKTLSGGVCINDCMFHVAQHDMPFGGIGNSGMGHYHGEEGFKEFSKLRPVFKQSGLTSKIILMLSPPYGSVFKNVVNLMLKMRL
jgi:coniferyl-aldehyde dehydrogenase